MKFVPVGQRFLRISATLNKVNKNKMNAMARETQWQNIMQMTEQLRELSTQEDWQKMNEVSTQRQIKLEHFFASSVAESEVELVAEGIQKILHSDQILMQISQKQKQQISSEVQKISSGRQAVKAYGQFKNA